MPCQACSVVPGVPCLWAWQVDPAVDSDIVRKYDEWMGMKLKGDHPYGQEPLGGTKNTTDRPSLERARHAHALSPSALPTSSNLLKSSPLPRFE